MVTKNNDIVYEVGMKGVLMWDGFKGVPHYLHHHTATIVKVNRKRLVVTTSAYSGELTINKTQFHPGE
jgi:hypothetical protein